MDDAELKALFALDAPPARDTAFTLAVLRRIEQRRLRMQAMMVVTYGVAAAAILYALMPVVDVLGEAGHALLLAAVITASLWLMRRDIPGLRYFFTR